MAKNRVKPTCAVPTICQQLQELQRQRVCNLKSRIMIENRLVATVATASGYHAGMEEADRMKRFADARKVIESVKAGLESETVAVCGLILSTLPAIDGFDGMVTAYEKEMEKLAKQLPVFEWQQEPEQRGFGLLSLAKIIGETGDLALYAAPGKLWKRMGCAPFESKGKMLMPATWRRMKPGLSAEEWEVCGYNPRRRSIAYLIGEGIVKQNGPGPYRQRYDYTKARAAEVHGEEWKPMRCHLHGMLLATKLLLKNLWCEWNGDVVLETELDCAALAHA
jgi:hypothetical protein